MTVQPPTVTPPEGYDYIAEGQAVIIFPKDHSVFYNNVQVLNRDLSILMISLFSEDKEREEEEAKTKNPQKYERTRQSRREDAKKAGDESLADPGIVILEALSASGLRSIRYSKEIKGNIKYIIANDLSISAVESIKRNIEFNKVDPKRVRVSHNDATLLMYQSRDLLHQYDVIDIDPYGSPTIFLDGAIQSISEGGLLCITCTDLGVLCGNHQEACFGKYSSIPLSTEYCHEMALRIVLAFIAKKCSNYSKYIVPLGCFSIDFYIRLFVRVYSSKEQTHFLPLKLSTVYQCTGCDTFKLIPLAKKTEKKILPNTTEHVPTHCEHCGKTFQMGGPVWNERICDINFIKRAIERATHPEPWVIPTQKRLIGLLTALSEEVIDSPLYYGVHSLVHTVRTSSPSSIALYAALDNLHYKVSQSHANPLALKTDAPSEVIWDVIRCWCKLHGHGNLKEGSSGKVILEKEPKIEVSFDPSSELVSYFKQRENDNITRFPANPEKNWGPKSRAPMNKQKRKAEDTEIDGDEKKKDVKKSKKE